MKEEDMKILVINEITDVLQLDQDEIDEKESFYKLGISSVQALKIINRIRKKLKIEIDPVAMFEYKCIAELCGYLTKVVNQ